jgi:hypothetical protein
MFWLNLLMLLDSLWRYGRAFWRWLQQHHDEPVVQPVLIQTGPDSGELCNASVIYYDKQQVETHDVLNDITYKSLPELKWTGEAWQQAPNKTAGEVTQEIVNKVSDKRTEWWNTGLYGRHNS